MAWVLTPKKTTDAILVVDYQSEGKSRSYNYFILENFVRANAWTPVEVAFYVPRNLPANSTVKIYFFNPSPYNNLYADDLQIDFF